MKILRLILAFLLIAGNAYSAELESYTKTRWGGLDVTTHPFIAEDHSSPDMSNYVLDEWGAITERDRFEQYNEVPGSIGNNYISGLFKFYKGALTKYFVACGGNSISKGVAGAWTDITGTTSASTVGSYWAGKVYKSKLWLANPTVPLKSWNGTDDAVTIEVDYPAFNCRYIELHKARLWAANSDSYPNRAYYCAVDNPEDWSTAGVAGYIDVAADDGDMIVGLVSLGGYLYIFKQNSIYIILGNSPNEFAVRKSNSNVGAIAPRSITLAKNGIYFLGRNDVFFFNGNSSVSISTSIEETIKSWEDTRKEYAAGIFDNKNHYYLAVTERGGTLNDALYVYDTIMKEWYKHDNVYLNYFCLAEGATDKGEIFAGSSQNDGIVWQLKSTDATEQIVHETKTQLETGVTDNTVITGTEESPIVALENFTRYLVEDSVLLMHFDGADGSTTFIDEAGHPFTENGTIELDTEERKVGTASSQFTGTSSELFTQDSPDFDLGTKDFVLEFWVKFDTLPASAAAIIGQSQLPVISSFNEFYLRNDGGGVYTWIYQSQQAGIDKVKIEESSEVKTGVWYHVMFIREGTVFSVYQNGILLGTTTDADAAYSSGGHMQIGNRNKTDRFLDGWLDELVYIIGSAEYSTAVMYRSYGGTITSDGLLINASGRDSLGAITWNDDIDSDSDVQFTTRTGATDDSVYFLGWETWASTSTVLYCATDATAWVTNIDTLMDITSPSSPQDRDILYYETDDNASPNCVEITISGSTSTNSFGYVSISTVDLSDYKWIGYWLKSPTTGSSVRIAFGETVTTSTVYSTPSTTEPNTWEYHYMPIDMYEDVEVNNIKSVKLTYLGDGSGDIYLGDLYAYTFLEDEATVPSTPNDWIQYKGILGARSDSNPKIINVDSFVISIEYDPGGTTEPIFESSYYTQYIDLKAPQVNKGFYDLFLTAYSTTDTTISMSYDIDYGKKSGYMEFDFEGDDTTRRMVNWFDPGTWGRRIQLHVTENTAAKISPRQVEIRFRKEGFQPN